MVEMGLIKQSPRFSGAIPMMQSPAATKSAGRVLRIWSTAQDGSAIRTCIPRKPQHQRTSADRQLCIEISYTKKYREIAILTGVRPK